MCIRDRAYEYLLNLIINNHLESSKVYSERYFAEIMGISRTPVREALLQLQREGYIIIPVSYTHLYRQPTSTQFLLSFHRK